MPLAAEFRFLIFMMLAAADIAICHIFAIIAFAEIASPLVSLMFFFRYYFSSCHYAAAIDAGH